MSSSSQYYQSWALNIFSLFILNKPLRSNMIYGNIFYIKPLIPCSASRPKMLQILHALVRSNKSSDKSYLIIFIQSSQLKSLRNSQLIFSLNDKYISENFPEIFHFSQYFTEIAVFIFRKYQQHHNIGNKII